MNSTSPTDSAPEDPLRSPLQLGGARIRAFTGGVVTSVGVTLFFDYWGRDVLFVVTAAICITIAVFPVAPTRLWYSPFLTGLGLGLLMTGTFLWFRPHVTGATGEWLIAVAVGSLLFWLLPGRHGRPVFLLTMLVAAMIGVAVWDAGTTIDGTDHVVRRFLDSIEPSVVTLIVFAVAYTLYGMALDARRDGRGSRHVLRRRDDRRRVGAGHRVRLIRTRHRGCAAADRSAADDRRVRGEPTDRLERRSAHRRSVCRALARRRRADRHRRADARRYPITVYIGVVLILFGLLLGRGVHGD